MAKDITQELNDKVQHAKGLHATAHANMREWEQLYLGEFEIKDDAKDTAKRHDGNKVYKPSEPRAIVNKFLAVLGIKDVVQAQVLPSKESDKEERICTKLEQFLDGYQRRVQQDSRKAVYRQAVQWAFIRGKCFLQVQFVPEFVGTNRFPLRSIAPDPLTVYEVTSDNGVLYFVREYERYALDLMMELERKGKGWRALEGDYADTDLLTVVEYWDGEYYACTANRKGVTENGSLLHAPDKHNYGFVPLAIAYLEDTPLCDTEDQFASPLGVISDALKEDAAWTNTLSHAVEKFFFPLMFYKSMDGKPVFVDPYAKGDWQGIAADSKLEVYSPTANVPILERYLQKLRNDINKFTFPEISFAEGNSAESGYARAQALSQVKDRVDDKAQNLSMAFGWHFSQVLKLAETFYPNVKELGGWQVAATSSEIGGRGKRRLVTVTDADIDGHTEVACSITPQLPQERMQTIQEINLLRQRDPVTKKPIVDDRTLREMHPRIFEQPDVINQRIDEETYSLEIPEVKAYNQKEWYDTWRKDHPVQTDNTDDLSKLSKQDLVALVRMAQMQIQNPQAFQQALQGLGQGGMHQMPDGSMMPDAAMQGGAGQPMLPPQVAPPQMQSGNPNPMQGTSEEQMVMEQMRRGMNPPR